MLLLSGWMATLTENPSNDEILAQRLQVYEEEIQNLTKKLNSQEVDINEVNDSLTKITRECQTQKDKAVKEEKLKASAIENYVKLQGEHKLIQDKILKLNNTNNKYVEEIKSLKSTIDIKSKENNNKTELNNTQMILKDKEITAIQTMHAKEIGKLKMNHMKDIEERVNRFAKSENSLKNEIINLNNTIETQDRDYKDTIASQATRLVAYEHQINVMEKQMVRLRLQHEYSKTPKLDNDEELSRLRNENVTLKSTCQEKNTQISDLVSRLGLVRINQHHDFRSRSNF